MALKDWEKIKGKESTYYRKNLKILGINKIEKGSLYWEEHHKSYIVTNNWNFDKHFSKTKAQAIKYAKAYMKKH